MNNNTRTIRIKPQKSNDVVTDIKLTIPTGITNGGINITGFTSLSSFVFNNQQVDGISGVNVTNNLAYFSLSGNKKLSNNIDEFALKNKKNLKYVNISNTNIGGSMKSLTGCNSLTELQLNSTALSGDFYLPPSVQTLVMSGAGNDSKLNGIVKLLKSTNLKNLTVTNNKLSSTIPDLYNIPNVENIDLSYNRFTGTLPNISTLTKLKKFTIKNNYLSASNIAEIPASLNYLDASNNNFASVNGLQQILNVMYAFKRQKETYNTTGIVNLTGYNMPALGNYSNGYTNYKLTTVINALTSGLNGWTINLGKTIITEDANSIKQAALVYSTDPELRAIVDAYEASGYNALTYDEYNALDIAVRYFKTTGLWLKYGMSFTLDPDAVAYISQISKYNTSISLASKLDINWFVQGLKGLNLWDGFVCWPMRSIHNAGIGKNVYALGGFKYTDTFYNYTALGYDYATPDQSPHWDPNGIYIVGPNAGVQVAYWDTGGLPWTVNSPVLTALMQGDVNIFWCGNCSAKTYGDTANNQRPTGFYLPSGANVDWQDVIEFGGNDIARYAGLRINNYPTTIVSTPGDFYTTWRTCRRLELSGSPYRNTYFDYPNGGFYYNEWDVETSAKADRLGADRIYPENERSLNFNFYSLNADNDAEQSFVNGKGSNRVIGLMPLNRKLPLPPTGHIYSDFRVVNPDGTGYRPVGYDKWTSGGYFRIAGVANTGKYLPNNGEYREGWRGYASFAAVYNDYFNGRPISTQEHQSLYTLYKFTLGKNLTLPGSTSVLNTPLDLDAYNYILLTGITDTQAQIDINNFVVGAKKLNLWNSIVCWPMTKKHNTQRGNLIYALGGAAFAPNGNIVTTGGLVTPAGTIIRNDDGLRLGALANATNPGQNGATYVDVPISNNRYFLDSNSGMTLMVSFKPNTNIGGKQQTVAAIGALQEGSEGASIFIGAGASGSRQGFYCGGSIRNTPSSSGNIYDWVFNPDSDLTGFGGTSLSANYIVQTGRFTTAILYTNDQKIDWYCDGLSATSLQSPLSANYPYYCWDHLRFGASYYDYNTPVLDATISFVLLSNSSSNNTSKLYDLYHSTIGRGLHTIRDNFDIDAYNFIQKTGITDPKAQDNMHQFVKGVKQLGIWDNMRCWPLRSTYNAGTGTNVYGLGNLCSNDLTVYKNATWTTSGFTFGTYDYLETTFGNVQVNIDGNYVSGYGIQSRFLSTYSVQVPMRYAPTYLNPPPYAPGLLYQNPHVYSSGVNYADNDKWFGLTNPNNTIKFGTKGGTDAHITNYTLHPDASAGCAEANALIASGFNNGYGDNYTAVLDSFYQKTRDLRGVWQSTLTITDSPDYGDVSARLECNGLYAHDAAYTGAWGDYYNNYQNTSRLTIGNNFYNYNTGYPKNDNTDSSYNGAIAIVAIFNIDMSGKEPILRKLMNETICSDIDFKLPSSINTPTSGTSNPFDNEYEDPDAKNYIIRANIKEKCNQEDIKAFVVGLKSANLWDNIKCYPLRKQYNSNSNIVYSIGGYDNSYYKNDDHRGVLYSRTNYYFTGNANDAPYYNVPLPSWTNNGLLFNLRSQYIKFTNIRLAAPVTVGWCAQSSWTTPGFGAGGVDPGDCGYGVRCGDNGYLDYGLAFKSQEIVVGSPQSGSPNCRDLNYNIVDNGDGPGFYALNNKGNFIRPNTNQFITSVLTNLNANLYDNATGYSLNLNAYHGDGRWNYSGWADVRTIQESYGRETFFGPTGLTTGNTVLANFIYFYKGTLTDKDVLNLYTVYNSTIGKGLTGMPLSACAPYDDVDVLNYAGRTSITDLSAITTIYQFVTATKQLGCWNNLMCWPMTSAHNVLSGCRVYNLGGYKGVYTYNDYCLTPMGASSDYSWYSTPTPFTLTKTKQTMYRTASGIKIGNNFGLKTFFWDTTGSLSPGYSGINIIWTTNDGNKFGNISTMYKNITAPDCSLITVSWVDPADCSTFIELAALDNYSYYAGGSMHHEDARSGAHINGVVTLSGYRWKDPITDRSYDGSYTGYNNPGGTEYGSTSKIWSFVGTKVAPNSSVELHGSPIATVSGVIIDSISNPIGVPALNLKNLPVVFDRLYLNGRPDYYGFASTQGYQGGTGSTGDNLAGYYAFAGIVTSNVNLSAFYDIYKNTFGTMFKFK